MLRHTGVVAPATPDGKLRVEDHTVDVSLGEACILDGEVGRLGQEAHGVPAGTGPLGLQLPDPNYCSGAAHAVNH